MRLLVLLVLGGLIALLVTPFVLTSRAREQHAVTLPARITHKSENPSVRYSTWQLSRDATVEYTLPETGGVSYFDVHPSEDQYDTFRTGQAVQVSYLLARDIPKVPLSDFFAAIHALPVAKLRGLEEPGLINAITTPAAMLFWVFGGSIAALLMLWRITRWKLLGWAAALAVLAGVAVLLVQEFPRTTRPPSIDVRSAQGKVQSINHITSLFSSAHERGVIADQPVDVVGVEFIPEGRTEPVLAVDLIDRGSIPGLKEKGTVAIRYERASPRIAYITGATRDFPEKNFRGTILQGLTVLALCVVTLGGFHLAGKAWKRRLAR